MTKLLEEDGLVYTGHASILVQLSGKTILFDPVLKSNPYGNNWLFYPPNKFEFDYSELSGVFVSHIHQDHYDIEFLQEISGKVPIFILDGRPNFIANLKKNNIEVQLVKPDAKVELLDGVFIYGVLNEKNGVDASCAVFNENLKIYHGNDNYCEINQLENLRANVGAIDIACIPYAYINWYPQLLKNLSVQEKKSESYRLKERYCNIAIQQARALAAKQVIPFGANLFLRQSSYSDCNMEILAPVEFREFLESKYSQEQLGFECLDLYAGDKVSKVGENFEVVVGDTFANGKEFRDEFNHFYKDLIKDDGVAKKNVTIALSEVNKEKMNQKMVNLPEDLQDQIVIKTSDSSGVRGIIFDAPRKRYDVILEGKDISYRAPYHSIETTGELFKKFVGGEISFENIIGERAFQMIREPNDYRFETIKALNTIL